MSTSLGELRLVQPSTVKEAVAARFEHPGSRFIAGGTDLIVNMRRGITRADLLVDLSGIGALTEITAYERGMVIGTGVTLAALTRNPEIAGCYRALVQAAEAIA
ncbi:MAG: FAD binding domain-containing protein, partial [Pseudolabrys sp.]